MNYQIINGDCVDEMKKLPDCSVDAIVTDPPYGLSKEPDIAEVLTHWLAGEDYIHKGSGFMGKTWDSFVPGPTVWRECFRVLKPGGYLLSFGGTRTYDLLTIAIRMSGFEIRDSISWIYGSGFPKNMDIGKAIDKAAGEEREVIGVDLSRQGRLVNQMGDYKTESGWSAGNRSANITAPATEDAKKWDGWGSALNPAVEPIVVARKPISEKTLSANVVKHGTGGLNVKACRVPIDPIQDASQLRTMNRGERVDSQSDQKLGMGAVVDATVVSPDGRFPANLIHDGSQEVLSEFPDDGKTARFFYCAKANSQERHEGLEFPGNQFKHGSTLRKIENTDVKGNYHPTVKPVALMRYLCRLVTPPGGTVLDMFSGSGSTGKAAIREGFSFIGIDSGPEYCRISEARCWFEQNKTELFND